MYREVSSTAERRAEPLFPSTDAPAITTGTGAPAPSRDARVATEKPGLPDYLRRHYRWVYIWSPAVWFFDHQPIINVIVFGQHRRQVLDGLVDACARTSGRRAVCESRKPLFGGSCHVVRDRVRETG